MRRLLIVLGVVLVLLIVGDIVARRYAEHRAADVIATSLDLSEQPQVSLGGFPFLLDVARGRVPSMTLSADRFVADGVQVETLEVSLHDVAFSMGDLVSGLGTIDAGRGDGTATLSGPSVTDALRRRGFDVTVRFEDGHVLVDVPVVGEVAANVVLEGSAITIRPTDGGIPGVSLPLPQLVDGVEFTAARVTGSAATLWFTLSDTSFTV